MYELTRYSDPRFRCLCGVHVERAACILAILGTIHAGFCLCAHLIAIVGGEIFVGYAAWNCAFLGCNIAILVAQAVQRPFLYIPYLAMAAFQSILFAVGVTVMAISLVFWHNASANLFVDFLLFSKKCKKQGHTEAIIFMAFTSLTSSLMSLASVWIVWRAYKFTKTRKLVVQT